MGVSFDRPRLFFRTRGLIVILLVSTISVLAMLPKVDTLSDLLWAEDGAIFASDVFALGWKSILTPYAGYLHFFPRLIALIPTMTGIETIPVIFLAGWFVSVGYALFVVFISLTSHNLKRSTAVLACLSIFVLPSSGEIYFNITNSQWFIGLGLCVYFIVAKKPIFNWMIDLVTLPILALTGPFSVILLPFAILKIIAVSKNYSQWSWRIAILFVCTVIQAGFFLSSSRTGGSFDLDISNWLSAFNKFLTFGIGQFGFGASAAVWLAIAYALRGRYTSKADSKMTGFILLGLAAAYFAVSLWSTKGAPDSLDPFGGGARYYFIPYALILVSWLFLLEWNSNISKYIVLFLIFTGLMHVLVEKSRFADFAPARITKSPTDYTAFVHLNRTGEAVDIQINPFWHTYPSPWRIKASIPSDSDSHPFRYFIKRKDVLEVNGRLDTTQGLTIDQSDSDPFIVFSVPFECSEYDYIAVKTVIDKEVEGQVQLFWQADANNVFSPEHSRARFQPKGVSTVHFALRNRGVSRVRLDPSFDTSKSTFQQTELICYD